MDDEIIWATSTTGDEFQCVHVDAWKEAQKRIDELNSELALVKIEARLLAAHVLGCTDRAERVKALT